MRSLSQRAGVLVAASEGLAISFRGTRQGLGRHAARAGHWGQERGVSPAPAESWWLTMVAVGPAIPLCQLLSNLAFTPEIKKSTGQERSFRVGMVSFMYGVQQK